jgi:hypothetical protein
MKVMTESDTHDRPKCEWWPQMSSDAEIKHEQEVIE